MKAVITGISGFIGSALNKRLLSLGWETSEVLSPDADYVFLFGSPSSNVWFDKAFSYSLRETLENFFNAADFCDKHNIKLIYPSSGTVYQGDTAYSKTKSILDVISSMYGIASGKENVLGLRIFAGYGVGESHKKNYSSIVYSFIQEMKAGRSPVIWGDGEQIRDFIYIDDIVDNIIWSRDEIGVIDIGTGVGHSFNKVIEIINKKLETNIEPTFIQKPNLYIDKSICKNPSSYKVSLEEGIERIINEKTLG